MTNNVESSVVRAAGGLVWRDSSRGKEILVVHRKEHKDWTLPKGKLRRDESWQDAAVREVKEETGYDARIESFAGITSYMYDGKPKVVLFWNMIPGEDQEQPRPEPRDSKEVDSVVWMTAQQALHRLDYADQTALIADSVEETSRKPPVGSRIKERWDRLWMSDSAERLAHSLVAYRIELQHLMKQSEGVEGKLTFPWADHAFILLDKGQQALDDKDIDLGWRCFHTAHRLELYHLHGLPDERGYRARAQGILNEAMAKLASWRRDTIEDVLPKNSESEQKPDINVVYYASQLLGERHDNVYRRLKIIKRQFGLLSVVASLSIVIWILLAPPLLGSQATTDQARLLVSVMLFGIMGACTSGILSIANAASTKVGIPQQLLESWITLARLLVGAIAALAVYTFLIAGLLDLGLGEIRIGLILSVAFAAGFTERLMIRVVEAVAK